MTIKIYIPTKGRAKRQATLERLPEKWQKQVMLVVPTDEAATFREAGFKAKILPCQAKGITATRDWILDHAKRASFDHIVMFDDDLVLQKLRPNGKITNLEGNEFDGVFKHLDDTLKKRAHASLGVRFLAYDASTDHMMGRAMYALAYNIPEVVKARARFGKGLPMGVGFMEDFNITLQLLRAGLPNHVSLVWRVSPYAANAAGGCSTYRTPATLELSAKALVKAHAPFVKLRWKPAWKGVVSKDGEQVKGQWDVTIQWKKALDSANKLSKVAAR